MSLNPIRSIFYWFFPPVPKKTFTEEGERMRNAMRFQVFFHLIFFVGNLMAIGAQGMLFELAWFMWSFSVYLNLREAQIIIYIISMVAGGITNVSLMSTYTQIPLLVFILELVFLFLSSFYILMYYKDYRMGGGIKGKRHGANKLLKQGGNCLSGLCGTVTEKANALTKGDKEQVPPPQVVNQDIQQPLLMQQMMNAPQMNYYKNGPQGPSIN